MTRNARRVELPLELAPSGGPLRHRVADAMIDLLRTGHLRPGDTLPATRALAAELAISRTAVLAAYDELAAAGFIQAVGGSATVVSPGADLAARAGVSSHVSPLQPSPSARLAAAAGPRWNLLPGYPDTGLIAADHWRAAWRAAARLPAPSGRPFGPSHGPLREALAVHLRRTRGVAADPADIIPVPGVCAGLRALVAAAGMSGRPVAFEQPGYPEGRDALRLRAAARDPGPGGRRRHHALAGAWLGHQLSTGRAFTPSCDSPSPGSIPLRPLPPGSASGRLRAPPAACGRGRRPASACVGLRPPPAPADFVRRRLRPTSSACGYLPPAAACVRGHASTTSLGYHSVTARAIRANRPDAPSGRL
jgi:hypothetical protein